MDQAEGPLCSSTSNTMFSGNRTLPDCENSCQSRVAETCVPILMTPAPPNAAALFPVGWLAGGWAPLQVVSRIIQDNGRRGLFCSSPLGVVLANDFLAGSWEEGRKPEGELGEPKPFSEAGSVAGTLMSSSIHTPGSLAWCGHCRPGPCFLSLVQEELFNGFLLSYH